MSVPLTLDAGPCYRSRSCEDLYSLAKPPKRTTNAASLAGATETSTLLVETSKHAQKSSLEKRNNRRQSNTEAMIAMANYFWSFVVLGLYLNFLGPAMPELLEQTGTKPGEMSKVFMSTGITYASGSIISGVILEHIPNHIHLWNAMVLSITTVLLCSLWLVQSFQQLIALSTVYSLFVGGVDTTGNTAMMSIIRERPHLSYAIQLLMATYNLGALITPLIINLSVYLRMQLALAYLVLVVLTLPPVMVSLFYLHPRSIHRASKSPLNHGNEISNDKHINNNHHHNGHSDIELMKSEVEMKDEGEYSVELDIRGEFCFDCRNRSLVITAAMGSIAAMCLEIGFGAYLTEYTLEYVRNGSAHNGRFVTFLYFGFGCLSRAAAALSWLSVGNEMILCCIVSMACSITFIWFAQNLYAVGLCACVFGCSITPFFGSQFTFVEFSGVRLTGLPSGIMMLGAGIGASLGPALIGHFSSLFGWMMFPYLMFGFSVVFALLLVPLLWLGQKKPKDPGQSSKTSSEARKQIIRIPQRLTQARSVGMSPIKRAGKD